MVSPSLFLILPFSFFYSVSHLSPSSLLSPSFPHSSSISFFLFLLFIPSSFPFFLSLPFFSPLYLLFLPSFHFFSPSLLLALCPFTSCNFQNHISFKFEHLKNPLNTYKNSLTKTNAANGDDDDDVAAAFIISPGPAFSPGDRWLRSSAARGRTGGWGQEGAKCAPRETRNDPKSFALVWEWALQGEGHFFLLFFLAFWLYILEGFNVALLSLSEV